MTIKTKAEAWFWIAMGLIACIGWHGIAKDHHIHWLIEFIIMGFLGMGTWLEGALFLLRGRR